MSGKKKETYLAKIWDVSSESLSWSGEGRGDVSGELNRDPLSGACTVPRTHSQRQGWVLQVGGGGTHLLSGTGIRRKPSIGWL